MRRYLQVFLLAVAFDLYWALVVLFREQGLIIWIALAILACLLCRLYTVLRHWSGGGGQPAGYALGADGADCLHGRVPDAAMDGGIVADVRHRLDAADAHHHAYPAGC
jgi:hypothetical protein